MHGVGIVAMGLIMDAIMDAYPPEVIPDEEMFRADLVPLRNVCRWTSGSWDFGPEGTRKWNQVQNTPKDILLVADHLLAEYKRLVWDRASKRDSA